MDTDELIATLGRQARPLRPRTPRYLGARLLVLVMSYMAGAQFFLHLRTDLLLQLARPLFLAEVGALLLLIVSSAASAVLVRYPDLYQKRWPLNAPYLVFVGLALLMVFQLLMPTDARMLLPAGGHGMECALCISSVALIPAALLFGLIRTGASVHPLRAGSFAVLAATGIGCLTLRLSESNDSLMHLLSWHYLPTLLFSLAGALAGKYLLRW